MTISDTYKTSKLLDRRNDRFTCKNNLHAPGSMDLLMIDEFHTIYIYTGFARFKLA